MPGQVALLDELEAARFAGYTALTWESLPRRLKVYAVAQYFMSMLLEVHREDAVSTDVQRRRDWD